jgi:hypothetical protein
LTGRVKKLRSINRPDRSAISNRSFARSSQLSSFHLSASGTESPHQELDCRQPLIDTVVPSRSGPIITPPHMQKADLSEGLLAPLLRDVLPSVLLLLPARHVLDLRGLSCSWRARVDSLPESFWKRAFRQALRHEWIGLSSFFCVSLQVC